MYVPKCLWIARRLMPVILVSSLTLGVCPRFLAHSLIAAIISCLVILSLQIKKPPGGWLLILKFCVAVVAQALSPAFPSFMKSLVVFG